MPEHAYAENVLGIVGAVCWTVQFLPQIWKSYRTKSTEGVSPILFLLWGLSTGFLGPYVVIQKLNIPLLCQPYIFSFLSLMSWGQCLYYGRKVPAWTAAVLTATVMAFLACWCVGLVLALRPTVDRGNRLPCTVLMSFSSLIMAIALLPQYREIWRRQEVVGISMPFIAIDLLGGIFCDLSLLFKGSLDPLNLVIYTVVIVMDGVIVVAAIILNPRANRRRKMEAITPTDAIAVSESNSEGKEAKALKTATVEVIVILAKSDIESQTPANGSASDSIQ